jgi:hypothetical protein
LSETVVFADLDVAQDLSKRVPENDSQDDTVNLTSIPFDTPLVRRIVLPKGTDQQNQVLLKLVQSRELGDNENPFFLLFFFHGYINLLLRIGIIVIMIICIMNIINI